MSRSLIRELVVRPIVEVEQCLLGLVTDSPVDSNDPDGDADDDGHTDVGAIFMMSEMGMDRNDIACADNELSLTGITLSGQPFWGKDSSLVCADSTCH